MKIHEIINKDNWIQGNVGNNSKFCLLSFIYKIYGYFGEGAKVCNFVKREMIKRNMINPTGSPYQWNDKPERTMEEVKAFCVELNI